MPYVPTMAQADELLREYNKDPFHLLHANVVSGVMRYFAREYDPAQEEFWAIVGLLHDLDFELWPPKSTARAYSS